MNASTRRAILNDVKTMSYGLVAERRGLTRNQVAGIVWREKNPPEVCVRNPKSGKFNINGNGRHGPGIWARHNLINTR